MNKETRIQDTRFVADLKQIVSAARRLAYSAINFAQVQQNWLIGQKIVLQEQHGKTRAKYGKHVIEIASKELTAEFGKGFSERSLLKYRQFYLLFNDAQISPTGLAELQMADNQEVVNNTMPTHLFEMFRMLSWSHIQRIMRVQNEKARAWYLKEAAEQSWAYKTLKFNYSDGIATLTLDKLEIYDILEITN